MIFRRIYFIFPLFLTIAAFGQISTTSDTAKMDTLFFMNGEIRAVKVVDTIYNTIRFLPQKRAQKPHIQEVGKGNIFSLKLSDDKERIIYFHDSAAGNVFTVIEAKMYMLGEQEADKHYRNKWPFLIGFVVGVASPIAFSNAVLLSPIAPAVAPLHTLLPVIRVNTKEIADRNYLQYDTYLMGYEKVARKKNFMHSILGAGIGLAAGMGAWVLLK